MNSTTTIKIPDPNFKYPFCYGMLSGLMIQLENELKVAEIRRCPVRVERLAELLAQYKAVDDALNATFKT